jgi:hypothetical protein
MSQSQSNIEPSKQRPFWRSLVSRYARRSTAKLPSRSTIYPSVRALFTKTSNHGSGKKPFRSHEKVLALARTRQAFFTELIPFSNGTKTFSFHCAYDLYRYLYTIGPHRRQLVQKIDFFLIGGMLGCGSRTQEVYEWTCGMLCECVSLRRLGVGISARD